MNIRRQKYEIHNRRGMILLLVVAVLVLLALMGTVYILTASTDKQVSYASNDQANLNYATQGMLSIVRADILNTTLGPNGALALGSQTPARVWTGPDLGYVANGVIGTPVSGTPARRFEDFAGTVSAPSAPSGQEIASQPWLCSAMPFEPNTTYAPGTTLMASLASTQPLRVPPTLSEEVYGGGGQRSYGAYTPLISYLTPYLYDPADGQYDLGYNSAQLGTASGATIDVPNASVVMPGSRYNPTEAEVGNNPLVPFGTLDAMWNLLPYSSPNGTHFRFAVRIMDTSAMMNVNTGWIVNATSPQPSPNNVYYAPAGAAMAAYPLYALPGTYNTGDNPSTMQEANQTPRTRAGSYNPPSYDLLDWQNALANYEAQGMPYTATATNTNTEHLSLYGAGTELQWLAYGGAGGQFGLLAPNRLSSQAPLTPQMPNTFGTGTSGYGTGYQDFYTTYSWSRQYASYNPGTTVTSLSPSGGQLYPSRVNLNADISPGNATQIGTLASQIGSALLTCGYQQDHAWAYAINYLDYRYVAQSPASLYGSSLTYYNGTTPVSATLTGTTAPSGVALIANALQPFVNEFEVTLHNGGGSITVTGYGVELYNPYSVPVNISGWQIQFLTGATSEGTYPIPAGTSIGAGQYLVIDNGNVPNPQGTPLTGSVSPSALSPQSNTVVLEAPCPNLPSLAGISAGFGAVDATEYKVATTPPSGTSYIDISRSDSGQGYADARGGPIPVTPTAATTGITLGAVNSLSNGSTGTAVPLYNRAAGDPVEPAFSPATANYQILNWADANCIARECSTESNGAIDPITWRLGAGATTLPAEVKTNIANFHVLDPTFQPVGGSAATEEAFAQVYFDFPFDPRAALTSVDMPTTGVVPPNVLTMFSLNARADNPAATPVGLAYSSLLTRTPGLINVNTAGEVPLYDAIYDAAVSVAGTTKGPVFDSQLVADAIAYRDRLAAQTAFPIFSSTGGTGTSGGTVTATGATPAYDTYPGYNIKSAGDLLLAWLPELETISPNPTSFLQRDELWADCANNFCVHSDSFAVYGLVQAIRLNPNYVSNGGLPGAADWYRASQETPYNHLAAGYGGVYLAPRLIAPTSSVTVGIGTASRTIIPEFILEGQRRFVAIVDSSYSTPNNGTGTSPAPKIVAMKILPQ